MVWVKNEFKKTKYSKALDLHKQRHGNAIFFPLLKVKQLELYHNLFFDELL